MGKLTLKVPELEELEYRQKLLSDPKTMEYNKGYKREVKGYNPETGTIEFPREQWDRFYKAITTDQNKYFAYLINTENNEKIGYVQFIYKTNDYHYLCSIVIEASQRGKGYAEEAFKLMLGKAFDDYNLPALWYDVPESRTSLLKLLNRIGFEISPAIYYTNRFGKDEVMYRTYITKEKYEQIKANDNK